LNVAPQLLIVKRRSASGTTADWAVWHGSLTAGQNLFLNSTDDAQAFSPSRFTSTLPSSTVFSLGGGDGTNYNGGTFVAYCFAPVEGYSAFGSYTGTDSSNFIYLGFRPRFILIKGIGSTTNQQYVSWALIDSARDTYNVAGEDSILWANRAVQEGYRGDGSNTTVTGNKIDLLSNGFAFPSGTSNLEFNSSNVGTYIYAAFAENPFALNARAR
jgi:hypothetical protein